MEPRLVFRTHYQVDEPAYLGILIQAGSSPVRSEYPERVAQRLATEIKKRGGKDFNLSAAGYAVDLAHGLGLLNVQNAWTPLGHVVGLVAEPRAAELQQHMSLTPEEQVLYFRVFLEGDGAAMLFLAHYLRDHGTVPNGDGDWNYVAQQMFLDVYNEYLKLTSNTSDRVSLRQELDRIRTKGYAGKSGTHKMFIHLQAMYRIGLAAREEAAGHRRYQARSDRLDALISSIDSVLALEQVVREQRWAEVAVSALDLDAELTQIETSDAIPQLASIYRRIMASGIPLCPISTLLDTMQIEQLVIGRLVNRDELVDSLQELQRASPKDVRFHVDRSGAPAYVKLADAVLKPS